MPLTVVGYVRVSTDEQFDSGAGLEAQRRAIRDECQRRGWRLAEIYEDAASGRALTGRTGLKAALTALDGRRATALVVAKLDRLSRSLLDFAALMERGRRSGWALVALDLRPVSSVTRAATQGRADRVAGTAGLPARRRRPRR